MHTAIPCTGSTADQAASTVHVQLGAGEAPKLDLWQLRAFLVGLQVDSPKDHHEDFFLIFF